MQNAPANEQELETLSPLEDFFPSHFRAENLSPVVELPLYKKKKLWIGAAVAVASTAVIATATWAITKSSCDTSPITVILDDENLFPAEKCYDYITKSFPVLRDKGYDLASTIYASGRAIVDSNTISSYFTCKYFGLDNAHDQFNAACCYNPETTNLSPSKSVIVRMIRQTWNCSTLINDPLRILLSFACIRDY